MSLFTDLGLVPELLDALTDLGYQSPTPIQEKAIPIILKGKDLIAVAQTGTGKTAAFALPTLQIIDDLLRKPDAKTNIKALILTPTRELAIQIEESFSDYGKYLKIYNTVVFGGVSQHAQTSAIKQGIDILIATPGRLLDLMQQGIVKLGNLELFILDEADRMLDMGFINDVKRVITKIPQKRQTLLFSATMPAEIQDLAQSILFEPERVEVTPVSSTADTIKQSLYYVTKNDKKYLLMDILSGKEGGETIKSALVFTRTKHGADKLTKDLIKAGITALAIHGNKSQNARQAALNSFKEGKLKALIATDIAARGIDIDELTHVVNYELPEVPETYVHRIGRTGRAGNSGRSISFCDSEEMFLLKDIEKLIKKPIPVIEGHNFPMSKEEMIPRKPAPKVHQARNPNSRSGGGANNAPPFQGRASGRVNSANVSKQNRNFSKKG